jgi:hypothetical protein
MLTRRIMMSNVARMTAHGGTESTLGQVITHMFTEDGTLQVIGNGRMEVLIIGGGGGGGGALGGGGGAGALYYSSAFGVAEGTYDITIGSGGDPGAGRFQNSSDPGRGGNGNSTFAVGIEAIGGGGGGAYSYPIYQPQGVDGANGGGASGAHQSTASGGIGLPLLPHHSFTEYGSNNGGVGVVVAQYAGTGGGGATENGYSDLTADGGNGILINMDGNDYYWAAGGGGGDYNVSDGGNGGLGGGGGGAGVTSSTIGYGDTNAINPGSDSGYGSQSGGDGGDAGANTGSGGGGGCLGNGNYGGAGGSGIVIFRHIF